MTDQIKAQQGDRAARKVIIAIPGSPPFGCGSAWKIDPYLGVIGV